jgi:hypothetical protein
LTGDPLVRSRCGTGRSETGLTQKEVALVMGMSERGVRAVERRALDKLRRHPALRALWTEWIGEGTAQDVELTDAEIAALYNLARTEAERRAVDKMMRMMTDI